MPRCFIRVRCHAGNKYAPFVATVTKGVFIMSSEKIRQLVLDAMLAAMCAVLGFAALDFQNIKLTFEGFPIIVGALLFGPLDGFAIGAVGIFVYQVIRYGITATTVLWILPYALSGLLLGFIAKKQKFDISGKRMLVILIINELLITAMNTGAIFVDSKMYGYYHTAIITGMLAQRLVISLVKGAAFGLLMPAILKPVRKLIAQQNNNKARRT